jgi:hypothetical protein
MRGNNNNNDNHHNNVFKADVISRNFCEHAIEQEMKPKINFNYVLGDKLIITALKTRQETNFKAATFQPLGRGHGPAAVHDVTKDTQATRTRELYHFPGPFILAVLADTSSWRCREVDKGI